MKKHDVTIIFSSLTNMVYSLNTAEKAPGANDSSSSGSDRFTGTSCYEEADKLAEEGDAVSASKIADAIKRIEAKNMTYSASSRTRRDLVGSRSCVPAYLSNHPLSMYRRINTRAPKRFVNIFYDMCAPGSVDKKSIVEAGAKVLTAIRNIEKSGVRVNLFAGVCAETSKQDETAIFGVKIKNADKDFEALRCAYPLVNPSFLRRHYFRAVETNKQLPQDKWSRDGYGRPLCSDSIKDIAERINKACGVKFNAFVNFNQACYSTPEQIQAKILR